MRILILDIETSPNLAYVWGLWNQNVGLNQIVQRREILSYACKWFGEKKMYASDARNKNEKKLLKGLIQFLDEADVVIAHNANKFDLPIINGRALVHGLKPPSPYKVIDTLTVARRQFGFVSNRLDNLAHELGCMEKGEHLKFVGFKLWSECLAGNKKAWDELLKYNKQDVTVLEQVYEKMIPWIKNHPNLTVFEDSEKPACPKCNSTHIQSRGFAYTNVGKYRRFHCQSCGGWSRERFHSQTKEKRKGMLTNA